MKPLKVGDKVVKVGGEYTFNGQVRARFTKRSGAVRYVVENDDGLLHIFSDGNLEAVPKPEPTPLAEMREAANGTE